MVSAPGEAASDAMAAFRAACLARLPAARLAWARCFFVPSPGRLSCLESGIVGGERVLVVYGEGDRPRRVDGESEADRDASRPVRSRLAFEHFNKSGYRTRYQFSSSRVWVLYLLKQNLTVGQVHAFLRKEINSHGSQVEANSKVINYIPWRVFP